LILVLFLGVGAVWKLFSIAIGLEAYSACIFPVELRKVRMLWPSWMLTWTHFRAEDIASCLCETSTRQPSSIWCEHQKTGSAATWNHHESWLQL